MYFFIYKEDMITQEVCEELIVNKYIENESLRDSPSTLKSKAR
jgi:hypothetical protein